VGQRFAVNPLVFVAFSYQAREVEPDHLEQYTWPGGQPWATGTNMQHALDLARSALARSDAPGEIIMLTSGVPTCYSTGDAVEMAYPPTNVVFEHTLEALASCARAQLSVDLYVLGRPQETRTFGGVALVRDPERERYADGFADRVQTTGTATVKRLAPTDLEVTLLREYVRRHESRYE
jgi:uncharacterized protein with von Willebrand factor type A (vWA) domain